MSQKVVVRCILMIILSFLAFFSAAAGLSYSAAASVVRDFSGESFHYVIKKFGVKAGEAQLEYHGLVELDGQKLVRIVFTADGFNFFDQEKIYADPGTLFPVRVERDLNIFGKKEQIVGFYNAKEGTARIVKYKSGKPVDEVVFEKDRPIDNLYCFLFRYRASGIFEEGAGFLMNLPTQDVKFKISGKTGAGFYPEADEAWFMESQPRKYRVWFGTGADKIPLRIDGAVGLAKTAMILRKYKSGKIE